jgi:hypothetical protein
MTVEELLARLLRVDKTPLYCAGGECGFTEGKHIPTRTELEELVSVAMEQERERIRASAQKISTLDEGYHFVDCHFAGTPIYCVPELMLVLSAEEYPTVEEYASVLAPKVKP